MLAGAAIARLLVGDSGTQIQHDDRIVCATLAFVAAERGDSARPTAVSPGLQRILSSPPVLDEAIITWFVRTYR